MPREYEILWTGPALNDLRSIRHYIAGDGRPQAAKRLARKIRQAVQRLVSHPGSGRRVPEFAGAGYREVIVAPYRIVYELTSSTVIVLRVWHGRRDLGRLER